MEFFLQNDFRVFIGGLEEGYYQAALSSQDEIISGLRNTKWAAREKSNITGFIMGKAQELLKLFAALTAALSNGQGKLPLQAKPPMPLNVPDDLPVPESGTEFETKFGDALRCLEIQAEAIRSSVKRDVYFRYLGLMKFLLADYKEFHRYLSH